MNVDGPHSDGDVKTDEDVNIDGPVKPYNGDVSAVPIPKDYTNVKLMNATVNVTMNAVDVPECR